MTNKNHHTKRTSTPAPKHPARTPALIPVPERLALLIRLANSIPDYLRRTPLISAVKPDHKAVQHHQNYVRDFWDMRNEKSAISSVFHLRRLVDELPSELQAFVLHDDHGRLSETSIGYAPLIDPRHFQPYENIKLLGRSSGEMDAVIRSANERIDVEEKLAQAKINSQSGGARLAILQGFTMYGMTYRIGDNEFIESSLGYLAERVKERFFFVLAAEEILDALTGPDTEEKLGTAQYVGYTAIRSRLFVMDDEVHMSPPILFSFVVGIQASRVRKCEICGSYFWAGRKDKTVCSEKCNATRRKRKQRRWYEKEGKWKRFKRDRRKVNNQTKKIEKGES